MLRKLAIVGFVGMIVALLDPLEGSLLAAAGLLLVTVVAHRARLAQRRWLDVALAAAALGLASIWGFSAVGGIGGDTGRSMWWALTMLPMPVGWLMGLVGGYQVQRDLKAA